MMKVFLIVVLVIIGLLFVKILVARRKLRKRWKQEEEYALQISRKVYEPLSLSERYAFIFVFDVFMKNIRTSVRDLAIVHHQIEFESKALGLLLKMLTLFSLQRVLIEVYLTRCVYYVILRKRIKTY